MDDKEELRQQLQQELQWVKYRQEMLDIIEKKLIQMREIAVQVKEENLSPVEIEALNAKLNNLVAQVNALDEESKYIENKGIVE
jgi:flagellin-like hook-associated protein FlgL